MAINKAGSMSTKFRRTRRAALAASLGFALFAGLSPLSAATIDWDISGAGVITGGTGAWNTTNTFWTTDSGASNISWNNANIDTARFSGTSGTVTLGENITVGGLIFSTGGYTIASTSPIALTLGATDNIFNVTTGTATISGVIAGGAGNQLTVTGAGTLSLTNTGNTFTGNIVVDGGKLSVEGSNGAAGDPTRLGSGAKTITLQNGGTYISVTTKTNPTSTNTKSYVIGTGGGTLEVGSAGMDLDDAGQFSGAGTLTKTGTGILAIKNTYTGFTGDVVIQAGTLQINNTQSLGSTTEVSNITITGGAFDINVGSFDVNKTLSISGTGTATDIGAITNSSTTAATLNGLITMAGNASVGGSGNLTFALLDGGNATRTFTKVGAGSLTLNSDGTNFTGTTTVAVNNGVLVLAEDQAFGSSANITVAAGKGLVQTIAAAPGYNYSVNATGVLGGSTAFFNSLTVGGNLNALPKTIAQTAAGINATTATTFSLANDASKYFGLAGSMAESVTVGTGTPWGGISNDNGARSWQTGTITANSDFDIQSLNSNLTIGNTGTAGQVTISTPNGPVKANVIGTTLKLDDTTPGFTSDLTFEVTSGATLQTVQSTSLGTNANAALNAKVNVLSGGTLNPNAGSSINGNVTIQSGGILLMDDATNLTGIGTITQVAGSITRISNNNALAGAQLPGVVAGGIVRMETSNITSLTAKTNQAAIFQVFGGDRSIGSNTFDGGVITNDGSSRASNNTSTTAVDTLTVGSNGLTIAATSSTTLTLGQIGSITATAGKVISGTGTLTIGSTTNIAGAAKAGTVAMNGNSSSGINVPAINVVAGTFQDLSGGMPTVIGGGTGLMTISNGATFDSRTGTLTNGTVNVLSGGTARFRVGGTDGAVATAAIAGLQGAGNLFLGNNTTGTNRDVNLSIGINNASTVFTGVIADSDATRNGLVTKVGTGTLTLSNANTYTLGTVVNAGTLLVMNTSGSATGAGAITVNAGAAFGGSGSVSGAVSFVGATTLIPGASPGTLNTGSLSLNSATTSQFELVAGNTTVGGGINDLVNVTGNLVLDGTLDVTLSGAAAFTGSYVLFDYSGTLTDNVLEISPAFLSNPNIVSASISIDPVNTQVLLNVEAIPEPSTIVLGALGLLGVVGYQLRRRRLA
jgi:fibronectin-binding autotransporter adhesin